MRVFAGPNGSGKSTVINSIRTKRIKGKAIDFGYYINADDISLQLKEDRFSFSPFDIKVSNKEFMAIAVASGLVNESFPIDTFTRSYSMRANFIKLKNSLLAEQLAQIIADFLRKKLLAEKKKFSFETVFHIRPSLILCEKLMRPVIKSIYILYQQRILR